MRWFRDRDAKQGVEHPAISDRLESTTCSDFYMSEDFILSYCLWNTRGTTSVFGMLLFRYFLARDEKFVDWLTSLI
jgi:hypothetical protein